MTGACIASSAFADEYQERHAEKVRRELDFDGDGDMGEFVEYRMDDLKESAMTHVHITHGGDREAINEVEQGCQERDALGRYYARVHIRSEATNHSTPRPCTE